MGRETAIPADGFIKRSTEPNTCSENKRGKERGG